MTHRWNVRLGIVVLCAACAVHSGPAGAAPNPPTGNQVGDAEAHFQQAESLTKEGKYEAACPLYELSQEEDPSAITLFQLAECHEHVGKITSAWKAYQAAADMARTTARSTTDPERKAAAQEYMEKSKARADVLEQRLPKLKVVVEKAADLPDMVVTIDGAPLDRRAWGQPSPIDPGQHEITATAAGRRAWSTTIRVAAAKDGAPPDLREVKIPVLETLPMPKQRVAALVLGGVTLGAVVLGSVFGAQSFAKWDEALSKCKVEVARDCSRADALATGADAAQKDALLSAHVSTASFVFAGVGLAATGILWFTASPSDPSVASIEVAPAAGPTGAILTVRARF